jgi:hypothetical protein
MECPVALILFGRRIAIWNPLGNCDLDTSRRFENYRETSASKTYRLFVARFFNSISWSSYQCNSREFKAAQNRDNEYRNVGHRSTRRRTYRTLVRQTRLSKSLANREPEN